MTDPAERINQIIRLYDTTVNAFSKEIGLKRSQALYDIINGKTKNITRGIASNMIAVHPELNLTWLLTGEGQMTKDYANMQEKERKISPIKDRILSFVDSLGISKREFYSIIGVSRGTLESKTGITEDVLAKFIAAYPDVSIQWLMTGEGPIMQEKEQKVISNRLFPLKTDRVIDSQEIPLYDFDASAGLVAIFNSLHVEATDYLRIPNLPPVDGAIYVRGESMAPLLKSGDIVMYKKKELSIDSILWGEIYLLSFVSDGDTYTAVKYIRKSDRTDSVCLASFNPSFAPMDIPMSSVTALALVKATLTFHTME